MKVYEFKRNSMEEVRISLTEFKGHKLIDIRTYYDGSEDSDPKWLPTRKGIAIVIRLLSELKKGIDKVLAKIELEEK